MCTRIFLEQSLEDEPLGDESDGGWESGQGERPEGEGGPAGGVAVADAVELLEVVGAEVGFEECGDANRRGLGDGVGQYLQTGRQQTDRHRPR